MQAKHVAVAGATGAVGQELLQVLQRREFRVGEQELTVRTLTTARR